MVACVVHFMRNCVTLTGLKFVRKISIEAWYTLTRQVKSSLLSRYCSEQNRENF